MAAYVDYEYYTGTFLGSAIAQADFPRLAMRASERIDELTFDQAAAVIETGTDTANIALIKLATCAVAEELQAQESGGVIESEKVGSHAVTYALGPVLTDDRRLIKAAKVYLGRTGLMYGGPVIE